MARMKDRIKDRGNWFCCTSNDPDSIETLKKTCTNFKRWFWIIHQPDHEDSKPHIHVMVMYGGSCYIRTCARILDIPDNFVQFCTSTRSYGRYLIHLDEDDSKIKYKFEDVHTNVPGFYKSMLVDTDDDVSSLFSDIHKFANGSLSFDELVNLHYSDFQSMSFSQKIQSYKNLFYLRTSVRLPDIGGLMDSGQRSTSVPHYGESPR